MISMTVIREHTDRKIYMYMRAYKPLYTAICISEEKMYSLSLSLSTICSIYLDINEI
jgi:hypothetical protein